MALPDPVCPPWENTWARQPCTQQGAGVTQENELGLGVGQIWLHTLALILTQPGEHGRIGHPFKVYLL